MKVDVTIPDDELETAAAAQPAEQAEPAAAGVADVLDAEFEAADDEPADGEPADEQEPAREETVFSIADIEAAREEAKAANERYLSLRAEWDNFRKRTAREREDERTRASEDLVTKLLPVVDDLERSLDHAAKTAPEGEFGEFVNGVHAVYEKLVDVLTKVGVEAIDPAGQPFDMNVHQAVAHVEDPSLPASTVRDVYQKGYRMGNRVIRTAMVTVSKGGPARAAEPGQDAPADEA